MALLDALVPLGPRLTGQPHVRHCWSHGKEEKMVEHDGSLSFCSESRIGVYHVSVPLTLRWLKQTIWQGLMSAGWPTSPYPLPSLWGRDSERFEHYNLPHDIMNIPVPPHPQVCVFMPEDRFLEVELLG